MKRFTMFLLPLLCTSCFSPEAEINDGSGVSDPSAVPVTFSIGSVELIPFDDFNTRSLSTLCSRMTLAVFKDGEKVKNINQLADSPTFGTFNISLSPGTYEAVLIAHNGLGNCSISSTEKITFASNKCTDTFYHYGTFTVSDASTQTIDLHRAVAMFRLNTTDVIPAEVSKMQFYYTGGSSTFNAVTGLGSVNSRQTETFSVSSMIGQTGQFDVYTFPHETSDVLKMTISAYNSSDDVIAERVYETLPVTINKITQSTIEFFGEGGSAQGGFTINIPDEGEWSEIIDI